MLEQAFAALAGRARADHPADWTAAALGEVDDLLAGLPLAGRLAGGVRPQRFRLRPSAIHEVLLRETKDAILKDLAVEAVTAASGSEVVLNHCCVFGRHARVLARRLPHGRVVAADIDSTWERLYRAYEAVLFRRPPANYHFIRESVYESAIPDRPFLVCFFGACGSLADAALDLAAGRGAAYVVGRTCCHENIAMNTTLSVRRPSLWNLGHRIKNAVYRRQHRRHGHYGCERYGPEDYPRSRTARRYLDSAALGQCARHGVDCRVCQTLIDLDRLLHLEEQGFTVLAYRDAMLVARRDGPAAGGPPA
jgi:hypothetical protein